MITLATAIALPLALQAAPVASDAPAQEQAASAITSLDDLPIEQTTAARCGIAFAVVEGMQGAGHPGATALPSMVESGGREFFVQAMVRLMDETGLSREALKDLVNLEVQAHMADQGEAALQMVPGCLLLKDATGA